MKALVKAKAEAGIWLEDVPKPDVGPNDVLVRVQKTSICGTDLHIVAWDEWAAGTIPVPMVIGHELARKLHARVGDSVRLISPLSSLDPSGWSPGELPHTRDFRVAGIFNSGFDEYDKRLVYLNWKEAQALGN